MLHGALGTKDFCLPLLPLLTPHFQVFSFDFVGHGSHNWQGETLSIENMAAQIAHFLQENNLTKPVVFGYSMGGYAAMYLEKTQPQTFASIMTFATIYNWTPENAQKQVSQMNWDKIVAKVPHFAQVMQSLHGEKTGNLFAALSDMLLKMGENLPISAEDMSKIQIPVWLGVGDRDTTVTLAETIESYKNLPKSHLFVLPNVPHPFERADMAGLAMMITKLLPN